MHRWRGGLTSGQPSLQPFLNVLALDSLELTSGGEVRRAPSGHEALVGPVCWLPDVDRFGLVAVRLEGGQLSAERVDESKLPSLERQQQVRALIAEHYRKERWWNAHDDLESRPGELVNALTLARLEDPDLLSEPFPPLDELLHDPLERDADEHHWRDFAACCQTATMSFCVTGMPEGLHMALSARARLYGMSSDQYVVAVLGHLAWRTPFAEDMEPWEGWDPDHRAKPNVVTLPRLAAEPSE